MRYLLIALIATALSGAAMAYPTLSGPTGMGVLPSAEVVSQGVAAAVDWQQLANGSTIPVRVTMGPYKGFEFGAMYNAFNNNTGLQYAWNAHAKIAGGQVFGGTPALGGQFWRQKDDFGFQTDFAQGYLVWTTDFGKAVEDGSNVELSAGVNWTQMIVEEGASGDAFRFYGGVKINILRDLALIGEYQTKASVVGDTRPITALTLRCQLGRNIYAQVGTTNADGFVGTSEQNIFAGVSLIFNDGCE